MIRRWGVVAAMPAAVAGIALATLGSSAASSAGKPTAQNALLCGVWMQSDAVSTMSGQSNQDHVDGADVSGGQYYNYNSPSGQNTKCQDEYNSNGSGSFNSGAQTFTWKVIHSNVNTSTQRGTEHGQFTLQNTSAWEAGFQGQISLDQFASGGSGVDNGTTTVYYVSGHPGGAGNFNTHGGAASGAHYRGTYGTIVYQDDSNNNSPCKKGSSNYCFQGLLFGQVN